VVSDLVSDSISVTSSNYVFRHRMGREYLPDISIYPDSSYHAFADNPYPFPADEKESSRLDALQDENKILFGQNVFAPIQPTHLPLNCSFYVGDVTVDLDEGLFPTGSIDLVHMRYPPFVRILTSIQGDTRRSQARPVGRHPQEHIPNVETGEWLGATLGIRPTSHRSIRSTSVNVSSMASLSPVQTWINDSGRPTSDNFIKRGTPRLGSQKINEL
jgi:hypothetical protein